MKRLGLLLALTGCLQPLASQPVSELTPGAVTDSNSVSILVENEATPLQSVLVDSWASCGQRKMPSPLIPDQYNLRPNDSQLMQGSFWSCLIETGGTVTVEVFPSAARYGCDATIQYVGQRQYKITLARTGIDAICSVTQNGNNGVFSWKVK